MRAASLAQRQAAFMAQLLDEAAPLPEGFGERERAGLAIYRGNYRAALIEALESTYEKTARWVGEAAFRKAAAHHLITHPPAGWTIDDAGAGFDQTCAQLFANDPEVAELAWLEWAMFKAFTAADVAPLCPDEFAAQTARFGADDWAALQIRFIPGSAMREIDHDLRAIWNAMNEQEPVRPETRLEGSGAVLVWREGERATFMLGEREEARAFAAAQGGAPYGEICLMLAGNSTSAQAAQAAQDAAMRAGAMLGRWLSQGLVAAIAA